MSMLDMVKKMLGDVETQLTPAQKRYVQEMKAGRTPIRVHERDALAGFPPDMLCDPNEFVPKLDPEDEYCYNRGWYTRWGAFTGFDAFTVMGRTSQSQAYYMSSVTPEKQFVDILVEKRLQELKRWRLDEENVKKSSRDLVLKIEMMDMEPSIWRTFRVNGGMSLRILQDKVISPVMGWTRHYHAYHFTEVTTGAEFGNNKSQAVDMMYKGNHGLSWVDDTDVLLGELLLNVGDRLLYTYDLGDMWRHVLTLEEIPPDQTGHCTILDGKGACPPEDGNGNPRYQPLLQDFAAGRCTPKNPALQTARGSDNWRALGIKDPLDFSLARHREHLAAAIASRLSAEGGQRVQVTRFNAPAPRTRLEETTPARDRSAQALCGGCGSPNAALRCAACKEVYYCSKECQAADWRGGHKARCAPRPKDSARTAAPVRPTSAR